MSEYAYTKERESAVESKTSYEVISAYMPLEIKDSMQKVPLDIQKKVNEIRIRANRPICYEFSGYMKILAPDGSLWDSSDSSICRRIPIDSIQAIVKALSRYSFHSCSNELRQCFFTIENGIRVGLGGVFSESSSNMLKYISSLNFRISRQVIGAAEEVASRLLANRTSGILICGGVNSGKTTLLRDLCRICGNRYKSVLIDERNELSATINGVATTEIGLQTDVLVGCTRSEGITNSIRTLSPAIIFCDEISTDEDVSAILGGHGCGIKFISSIHAESFNDLQSRTFVRQLIESGAFEYAVILEGEHSPGKVKEIRRLKCNG